MKGRALPFTPTPARLRRVNLLPSRGRTKSTIAKNAPPLVVGVRACPVLDTGGGGRKRAVACLVLVSMLLVSASCGRKGDPFLPQRSTNARVVDLKGAWQGGYIELKGGIVDSADPDSEVTGARVHYAIYPVAEPPCNGCPIEFQGFHTYGTEAVQEGRFFCKVPGALKGNIYFFEVQLAGEKSVLGPKSNRAKVVVE